MRRFAASTAAVAAAVLLVALAAGCTASASPPPPPRTAPNAAERAALADAQSRAKRDGIPIAPDVWTQLWTPTQGAAQIKGCVYRGSGGVIDFDATPLARQASGMSYAVNLTKDVSALTALGEFGSRQAIGRLVESCIAAYPIDRRLWLVAERDRGALYSYDLTVLRRCLVAHGQKVAQVPSRARFESLMQAGAPWNAYDQVVVTNRAAWYALADACPAIPPGMPLD
jgi:hypothetical protein